MTSVNASEAREKLYRLLDETASDHEPVLITGPGSAAARTLGVSIFKAVS
jgi:prevent-host-death family protein